MLVTHLKVTLLLKIYCENITFPFTFLSTFVIIVLKGASKSIAKFDFHNFFRVYSKALFIAASGRGCISLAGQEFTAYSPIQG